MVSIISRILDNKTVDRAQEFLEIDEDQIIFGYRTYVWDTNILSYTVDGIQ